MSKRSNTNPSGMALIRVLSGLLIFGRGWNWFQDGNFDGPLVLSNVQASLGELSGLLHWWGETVVLANPDASALFWRAAAMLVGVSFVLGAFTRPMGILACFFLLHGLTYGPESFNLLFTLLSILCLGCSVASAGRDFGMDKFLDESCPGWLTWTKHRKGSGLFN